jgi:Flavodoxin-like fold
MIGSKVPRGPDKTLEGQRRLPLGTPLARLSCGHRCWNGTPVVRPRRRRPQSLSRANKFTWSTSLRVFVLNANPVSVSYGATLHSEVVKTLRSRDHEIYDCDLYAERFDPVLSEKERMQYHDIKLNRAHIAAYAERLLAAEALVLVYPVWNEGFPAILKGFFDRVFIPGVSFTVGPDGELVTKLTCH